MTTGLSKVDDLLARLTQQPVSSDADAPNSVAPQPEAVDDAPKADAEPAANAALKKSKKKAAKQTAPSLAIPDYDSLAASQVVKRLDSLTKAQLKAVHAHETANRGRRTVLTKIARLQDNA